MIFLFNFFFRNCFLNYVDYFRCIKVKGEDFEPCSYFQKSYLASCPNKWVETMDTNRENGAFPIKEVNA